MIILVHGPDSALARAALAKVLAEHDPDGLNTSHLDATASGFSTARITMDVGSVGFFATPRVVVVTGLLSRAQSESDDEPARPPAGQSIAFGELFGAVPASNLLVLFDPTLATIPAAVKKALPAGATILSGEPPRGPALLSWLIEAAQERGASLDKTTARHLAESLYPQTWSARPTNPRYDRPPNLDRLGNEIAKLATAAHPGPITRAHIAVLTNAGDDDRLFRFLDEVAVGHLGPAVQELDKLLDAGEEPAKLTAQICQQIELAAVADAAGPRRDPVEVGKALGLTNPNRMIGVTAATRRQPGTAPRHLTATVAIDRLAKRGRHRTPADTLHALLTETATG